MDTKKPTAVAQGAPVAAAQARPYTGVDEIAPVRTPMTSPPTKPEPSPPTSAQTAARTLAEAPVPQDGLTRWLYSALDSHRLEAREDRRDMEGRLNEQFSSVDRRLSAVERQGAAVDSRLSGVEGRLSAVETGLAELGKRIDRQGAEIRGRSDSQFAELRGYIDSQVSELRGHIDSRVSDLRGQIENHRAETRADRNAIVATLSELCARMDRMEAASAAEKEQRDRRWRVIAWLVPALIGIFGVGLAVFGQFLLQRLAG